MGDDEQTRWVEPGQLKRGGPAPAGKHPMRSGEATRQEAAEGGANRGVEGRIRRGRKSCGE